VDGTLSDRFPELIEDVNRCIKMVSSSTDREQQFWRRMAYRAQFGFLEATVSWLINDLLPGTIEHAERAYNLPSENVAHIQRTLAAANRREDYIPDNGKLDSRGRKIKLVPQILVAVDVFGLFFTVAR